MNAANMLTSSQQQPQPLGFGPGGLGGGTGADFDTLMDLISSTVAPDSWSDVGGTGSMAPFEGNLSLVISTTQEVHEEIVDLLEQLRRLQDLQVTIEVRFITLQDNFFERIGVDFDFRIDDNSGLNAQGLVDSAIDDDGPDITIGLDPSGNPTVDLDLAFAQNSFASALPTFGGFDASAATTFGFAILSDIEAFFVMEAIQGDARTNVMQAPKITLFNGQFANLNDTTSRPFVTSVIPVVGDFAVAQQPVILVLAEGTQLNVQAVVSSDRRFVRLTLLPMFSQIGDVDTFTFEGRRSSNTSSSTDVDPDDPDNNETLAESNEVFTEGTTVQLPSFASTSVSTTVSVPDGGTVLMGGLKRLAEGRNERGTPIVNKIPYLNRLFKNVGIGRETQTLMMMVTPRIIIQEEEEERILGTPSP
jgi:general secretion pathway protein D